MAKIGINITLIWELVIIRPAYPNSIPILIKYLGKVKIDDNIEGIVRSLAFTEARGKAVGKLIELYERIPKEKDDLRWVFGLEVSVSALFTVLGEPRRLYLSMNEFTYCRNNWLIQSKLENLFGNLHYYSNMVM